MPWQSLTLTPPCRANGGRDSPAPDGSLQISTQLLAQALPFLKSARWVWAGRWSSTSFPAMKGEGEGGCNFVFVSRGNPRGSRTDSNEKEMPLVMIHQWRWDRRNAGFLFFLECRPFPTVLPASGARCLYRFRRDVPNRHKHRHQLIPIL